jgi:L-cysteate sulfo-lyase
MQMDRRPLVDRLAAFPRLGLANLPTPLEPMQRLTAHLDGPRLWVKREDATGLGFGGNKLRKLDYVLHEALSRGADTIVSGGVVQSNSQRQVAAVAAKLGLACHLAVYRRRNTRPQATRFSIGCLAHTSMTYRGPGTAMQPFTRS